MDPRAIRRSTISDLPELSWPMLPDAVPLEYFKNEGRALLQTPMHVEDLVVIALHNCAHNCNKLARPDLARFGFTWEEVVQFYRGYVPWVAQYVRTTFGPRGGGTPHELWHAVTHADRHYTTYIAPFDLVRLRAAMGWLAVLDTYGPIAWLGANQNAQYRRFDLSD